MLPKSLRISANVEGAAAFRILSVRLFHYCMSMCCNRSLPLSRQKLVYLPFLGIWAAINARRWVHFHQWESFCQTLRKHYLEKVRVSGERIRNWTGMKRKCIMFLVEAHHVLNFTSKQGRADMAVRAVNYRQSSWSGAERCACPKQGTCALRHISGLFRRLFRIATDVNLK